MEKGEAITVDKTNYTRAEAFLTAIALESALKKKNLNQNQSIKKKR